MILSGIIRSEPWGDQEVLAIGELPLVDYMQQMNGQEVVFSFSTHESPINLEEIDDHWDTSVTGIVDAAIQEESDDTIVLVPEKIFVGDYNVLEELHDYYGEYIVLRAEPTAASAPVFEAEQMRLEVVDPSITDVLYELVTGAKVVYIDGHYRVVMLVGGDIRYYRLMNGMVERIGDIVPRDLVDRLVRKINTDG